MVEADLLIVNAAELLTCAGFSGSPARGKQQADVGILRDAAVAIKDGRILAAGASARIRREYTAPAGSVHDAAGGVLLPGFCDPHTHLVFAGDRAAEWEQRMQGVPYLELLRAGGGILSTVEKTRAASPGVLLENSRRWLARCIEHGTTTLETKSGYCLDREGELKLLRVAQELQRQAPIEIVSTFLGAHVVPAEFKQRRAEYLELLEAMHVEIREQELAEYVDVFCESEAFTLEESERLLRHAQKLGFGLKLHAEQFTASGAARLGVRLGAASVDHLEWIGDEDLAALGAALCPPVAVLLPGVTYHLALEKRAPARRLIDAGIPLAIATDFNPGSSFSPSMPMMIGLATRLYGISASEAVMASTINAAHAVGRAAQVGSIEPGKRADLLLCDIPDHRFLAYAFGWNPVKKVMVGGRFLALQ